jgi:hypothetical protein
MILHPEAFYQLAQVIQTERLAKAETARSRAALRRPKEAAEDYRADLPAKKPAGSARIAS